MRFNNLKRTIKVLAAVAAVVLTAACDVEVDDTLGANLVPENQQMKAGYLSLKPAIDALNPRKYVETRLYQTDSIVSSNISNGYMGSTFDEKLGRRTAAFLTQYTNYYTVDSGYFGYLPFFDSAQLTLSIDTYGGDTTKVVNFGIFEVTSNDYLELGDDTDDDGESDTTFYMNFDPAAQGFVAEEPLFTFSIGGERGPATTAVTLTPTEAGNDFIDRLFLKKKGWKYFGDYSIYSRDSIEQWIEEFKGLYIKPLNEPEGEGAIYVTTLESSTLSIYGRNRRKEDPSLIQDTIGMVYYFYDAYYSTHSNVSINTIQHDYTQGSLNLDLTQINEAAAQRAERSQLLVEGMGGVLSELTFTQEFFDALQAELDKENTASGKSFSTLAFSQAMMYIYLPSSIYDYLSIGPELGEQYTSLLDEMDQAQSRLGLYTDYKKLTGISDYAYSYEQSYSTTLDYDGYINRSHGRYAMNITGYMQQLWNSYQEECKAAQKEGRAVDLSKVEKRVIYLGPEAYSVYSFSNSYLQGANNDTEPALTAPIWFEFTYNMVL